MFTNIPDEDGGVMKCYYPVYSNFSYEFYLIYNENTGHFLVENDIEVNSLSSAKEFNHKPTISRERFNQGFRVYTYTRTISTQRTW